MQSLGRIALTRRGLMTMVPRLGAASLALTVRLLRRCQRVHCGFRPFSDSAGRGGNA